MSKDWNEIIGKFEEVNVYHGKTKLQWWYADEGENGDFDPSDPNDVPLLRFTVMQPARSGGWCEVEDGSYCTMIKADAPKDNLYALGKAILYLYSDSPNPKKTLERASWMTLENV